MPSLDRFAKAQDDPAAGFEAALAEVRAGRKRGHWIWYILPQLSGLGSSDLSFHYGIAGTAEAAEYLGHPRLRARLIAIVQAVAHHLERGVSLTHLMGSTVDAQKLVSSLTLFAHVARTMDAADATGEIRTLAGVAEDVLAIAEADGYPRCAFTLTHVRERM